MYLPELLSATTNASQDVSAEAERRMRVIAAGSMVYLITVSPGVYQDKAISIVVAAVNLPFVELSQLDAATVS